MGIIAAGLSIIAAVVIALLLVAFRAGTRRQEQAGSLTCHPPGLAAGLVRRITGLHAEPPLPVRRPYAADRETGTVPSAKGPRAS
jgi:hypothetical protein